MGGGNLHSLPPEDASVSASYAVTVGNTKLSDAPVLFFVYCHKAFRAQLVELRRFATDAAEADSFSGDLAVELSRKFEFLKLVYKYHSAAEDEVIFLALDKRVKNIVSNYSLEHAGTDDLFTSIFHWLHVLEEEIGSRSDVLREVILCIGTIQSSICQHMLKEERQVFPLLIEKFSFREQASLVWQFICSVPVMVLEDFLPWMISHLSHEEKIEVENCIKDVAPNEDSLQQVISSWLLDDSQSSCGTPTEIMKGVQYVNVSKSMKKSPESHPSSGCFQRFWEWSKKSLSIPNVGRSPIHGLRLFQNAIEKDLRDIQEGLCQAKFQTLILDLDVLMARLNFLADVLVSYSNAFKKFFHPVLEEMTARRSSTAKQFNIDDCLENFQRLLYKSADDKTKTDNFLLQLQEELESLIIQVTKQFAIQRTEVFPIISKNCNHEMQKQLLYTSIHVLPLGLLKCVILWFSAHLSEEESQSILHFLSLEDSSPKKSFPRLLLQWLRFGYSGKTSVERFWKQLDVMFKVRCSCQKEHTEEASGSFSNQTQLQLCKVSKDVCPRKKDKSSTCFMSMDLAVGDMYETPYSSRMNQQMTFSGKLKPPLHLPDFFGEKNMDDPMIMDVKPIDLLFFFHKAMKMDLDYLVCGSTRLAADFRFLAEFQQRFHMIKFLYQIHSDAEDEIAFPALEAKGQLKNISHSFSIDHELETKHFDKVSFILNEMSELNMLVSTINTTAADHDRKMKYERLCLSLREICKSMHKLLSEHIQHEETELWGLFRNCFSIEEQEKIIGCMLGRISGEILQDMIPWLMESLTSDEQLAAMSLWRQATRKTMFVEWLTEWYNGHVLQEEAGEANNDPFGDSDPLEIVWKYLFEASGDGEKGSMRSSLLKLPKTDFTGIMNQPPPNYKVEVGKKEEKDLERSESKKICRGSNQEGDKEQTDKMSQKVSQFGPSKKYEQLLTMSEEELVVVIKKISCDSSLDPQKKDYIKQNLLMSRWNISQRTYNLEPSSLSSNMETVHGQHPSYRDPHSLIFGCNHYKRNCKLLAPCCDKLFTCIRCHDEEVDHSVDRKQITKMMCMKCLLIQPIGANCSNTSCKSSMGKYFCKICKLYDDERKIYHCPYCNLCRVGKGLGIDYFHCMKCNACMSRTLVEHVCREKCLEDNCPICHEYIFTSSSPVKALPCGHLMHSTCFQEYTCSHYTCPVCSKSLGDMQVYFKMLDALLAEEKMPDEYSNKTQVILCNDCGRKGNAPYHWLYHKCTTCGSYNSRLL
ncbi:Zinc finger CHY-type [Arabidopsis suecica]|uniref:Zinc finger CHY-type n=1 Tax=Arabidopsis suecica TaxID=45249 RepID=A0A8T2HJS7_ARASU|nr:Zinc finger CHY-type [Arabidopsis suecica]